MQNLRVLLLHVSVGAALSAGLAIFLTLVLEKSPMRAGLEPCFPYALPLCAGLLSFSAWHFYAVGKSRMRLKKGLCPTCGYPHVGPAACPECGTRWRAPR